MGVSKNNGTPKSSILIGFSIINHPFLGTPIFWKHPNEATKTCNDSVRGSGSEALGTARIGATWP